jgi:hypothetical protein
VSDQRDNQESAQLEQVNEDLTRSLKLCHSMLEDYRSKLAANTNGPDPANDDEPGDEDGEEPADDDSQSG